MTTTEFLNLLKDNPNKELKFRRVYDSENNDKLYSYGTQTTQRLGGVEAFVDDKSVMIVINSYL